jgi:hypothetical protein
MTLKTNINRREFSMGLLGIAGTVMLRRLPVQAQLRINGPRIMEHLNSLAEFSKNPQGGVSRVAYSAADLQGREYVMQMLLKLDRLSLD